MIAQFISLHAAAGEGTYMEPYYICGVVLLLLLAALLGLLAMGRGRDHS